MLFNSYIFIFLFLPVTLAGFCLLSHFQGHKPAKLWLTLASLFFYGWWNPVYIALIVASMLFNFWLGSRIGKAAGSGQPHAGALLFWGVAANLFLLGYYKYANFFVTNANDLLGSHWSLGKIVLPLGISFFTFTQIAYLVDARRKLACEYDLVDYSLFITFFPHLIAGPIIHHRQMMPQFAKPETYRFSWDNFAVGIWFFSAGLFKKVIVADHLSEYAGRVFDAAAAGHALYRMDAWAGLFCYTFQIYFDFSGYSDMAIGLARMFGITLPLNFNSPYKSENIIEFWRRWHMTLSHFLRDYLYIPLGGNRKGEARRYVNLLLTMLIGGLWHGAAWTFVLWGAIHGACLGINHLWLALSDSRKWRLPVPVAAARWSGRAFTFLLVALAWGAFRSQDCHAFKHLVDSLLGVGMAPGTGDPLLVKTKIWVWLGILLAVVWGLPNTAEVARDYQRYEGVFSEGWTRSNGWQRFQMNRTWACLTALYLVLSILSLSKVSEFLYYNF